MRIAKFVHNCLLVEEGGTKILFDPGRFGFVDGRVKPEQFVELSAVVLTHAHPDHLDSDALAVILQLNPSAIVLGNGESAETLATKNIQCEVMEEDERVVGAFTLRAFAAQHEPVLGSTPPRNTAWLVNGKLLVTGDSMDPALLAYKGIAMVAMPVMAPYTGELQIAAFAERLAPKRLLPTHDGYVRDFFLPQRYAVYGPYFAARGITVEKLMRPGDAVEL